MYRQGGRKVSKEAKVEEALLEVPAGHPQRPELGGREGAPPVGASAQRGAVGWRYGLNAGQERGEEGRRRGQGRRGPTAANAAEASGGGQGREEGGRGPGAGCGHLEDTPRRCSWGGGAGAGGGGGIGVGEEHGTGPRGVTKGAPCEGRRRAKTRAWALVKRERHARRTCTHVRRRGI